MPAGSPLLLDSPATASLTLDRLPRHLRRSEPTSVPSRDDADDLSARPEDPRAVRRDVALADLRSPFPHRPASARRAEPRRDPGISLLYRTRPRGGDARGPRRPRARSGG